MFTGIQPNVKLSNDGISILQLILYQILNLNIHYIDDGYHQKSEICPLLINVEDPEYLEFGRLEPLNPDEKEPPKTHPRC